MKYQQVKVRCGREASDAVAELITRLVGGVEVDDPAAVAEAKQRGGWDYWGVPEGDPQYVTLTAYFPLTEGASGTAGASDAAGEGGGTSLDELRLGLKKIEALGLGPIEEPQLAVLDEEEWANAWKAYYHPFRVGRRLVIVPSWEEYQEEPGDIRLTLDPGMAFGTGSHPTTALCLEALEERLRPGQRVLDVGCGSGILAVAAAKLGAARVLALDIDPVAVLVAEQNVAANGVEALVEVQRGELAPLVPPGPPLADLIVSNIVADVIISLVEPVSERLAPGGLWLAGGIIEGREGEVRAAMERGGFQILSQRESRGWFVLEARRG